MYSQEPDYIATRARNANLAVDQVRNGRQTTISYNVSPGRYGPVYYRDQEENVIDYFKWGLVPPFATTERTYSTFNCRTDSLEKGSGIWNHARQHQRCLVLVDGYYEWKKEQGNHKTPYYISRKDGNLLCMAGLWDKNEKVTNEGDGPLYTYTIITTDAHTGIAWLHHRMPVILDPVDDKETIDKWIDPELKWSENTETLLNALQPMVSDKLSVYEVSKEVGKISNNYKELTVPLSERKGTIKSFFSENGSGNVKKRPAATEGTEKQQQPATPKKKSKKTTRMNNSSPTKQKQITSFFNSG